MFSIDFKKISQIDFPKISRYIFQTFLDRYSKIFSIDLPKISRWNFQNFRDIFPKMFSMDFRKNTQIPNLMKIRPMTAELFSADKRLDGRTDTSDKVDSRVYVILQRRLKM
jgi:hypothetical protein